MPLVSHRARGACVVPYIKPIPVKRPVKKRALISAKCQAAKPCVMRRSPFFYSIASISAVHFKRRHLANSRHVLAAYVAAKSGEAMKAICCGIANIIIACRNSSCNREGHHLAIAHHHMVAAKTAENNAGRLATLKIKLRLEAFYRGKSREM